MLVFDITREETFKNITLWLDEVRELANKSICLMLVGNKSDLDKQYSLVM